ncbi:hypothetical protein BBJ28_00019150 [Nothophytophthora sp. Chile5]|nr:hypothetical protein BBJ28_00019150 [Nothophytophthora sp. Chile5]
MSAMNLSREQQNDLLFNADKLTTCVHQVMIWDDHQSRNIGELSFRSEVKAVKLRRDRYEPSSSPPGSIIRRVLMILVVLCCSVVVVLQNKIYVYNFFGANVDLFLPCFAADLKLVDHVETIANPKGLCALCPNPSNTVLACPGVTRGTVRIELYDLRKTTLITAHEAELSQVPDRAEIYSICFSPNAPLLACSSDKGTVHVFSLTAEGSGGNFVSDPTVMGHTAAQGLPPSNYSTGSGPRIVGADGSFYKAVFDANGECQNTSYSKFVQSDEDE